MVIDCMCQTGSVKSSRRLYGLLSLLAFLSGIAIYFLFRDLNNIVLFAWIPKPEFFETVLVPLKPSALANFLRYHLPDMLWFLSAILFLRFIWFYKIKTQKVYIYCFYGIGVILEASQLSKNVPGTFDWLDLFFMGVGAFVEGLLYKLFMGKTLEKIAKNRLTKLPKPVILYHKKPGSGLYASIRGTLVLGKLLY